MSALTFDVKNVTRGSLSSTEVAELEDALQRHYGDAVRPVEEVCRAIQMWGEQCSANHPIHLDHPNNTQEYRVGDVWRAFGSHLMVAAGKSSLLGRLLYGREALRTVRCPEHDGRWCGLAFSDSDCMHGCQLTGWLPAGHVSRWKRNDSPTTNTFEKPTEED